MSDFESVGPENWEDFVGADTAVLMIGKTDCHACQSFSTEIQDYLAEHDDYPNVRFGKMMVDQRGLHGFKKASPWLADVKDLPFTVIYKDGEVKKKWVGGGIDRLTNRLNRVSGS